MISATLEERASPDAVQKIPYRDEIALASSYYQENPSLMFARLSALGVYRTPAYDLHVQEKQFYDDIANPNLLSSYARMCARSDTVRRAKASSPRSWLDEELTIPWNVVKKVAAAAMIVGVPLLLSCYSPNRANSAMQQTDNHTPAYEISTNGAYETHYHP